MVQLISFIIFLISAVGAGIVVYRKIPTLAELPKNGHHGLKKPRFIVSLEKNIQRHHFHIFEKKVPLHKFLSKIKIWVLRIERNIDHLLHRIRKNAQELEKKGKKK